MRALLLMLLVASGVSCADDTTRPSPSGPAVVEDQGAAVMGSRTMGPLTDTVLGTMTELEQPINVLVLDRRGNPVPGVVVSWSASGGGSVSAPTSVTNAGGEAMIEYTFGAEARFGYGAVASVPGLIGSPVVWDLQAHPGKPAVLLKTRGDGAVVRAGGLVFHTVTVRDAHGNGTRGVWIHWAVASGGGSLFRNRSVTGPDGTTEMWLTLGPALGNQTVTATAPELPGAPTVTFTTLAAN